MMNVIPKCVIDGIKIESREQPLREPLNNKTLWLAIFPFLLGLSILFQASCQNGLMHVAFDGSNPIFYLSPPPPHFGPQAADMILWILNTLPSLLTRVKEQEQLGKGAGESGEPDTRMSWSLYKLGKIASSRQFLKKKKNSECVIQRAVGMSRRKIRSKVNCCILAKLFHTFLSGVF